MDKGTLFCLECRSESDLNSYKHFEKNHYRRGIKMDSLIDSIKGCGYDIELGVKTRGVSIFEKEDPEVIRIIGKKKL